MLPEFDVSLPPGHCHVLGSNEVWMVREADRKHRRKISVGFIVIYSPFLL